MLYNYKHDMQFFLMFTAFTSQKKANIFAA